MRADDERLRALAIAQGVYFATTGIWPLVDIESFERVTGPKLETWLVRTVSVLVTVIGATLIGAGARRSVTPETVGLAVGTAVGLGAIDTIYAGIGRIAPIYFADAFVEAALVGMWAVAARSARA
jgi:hypothetical protein